MPPKRKRSGEENDLNKQNKKNTPDHQFAYLKPHTRHVPERTIRSKWTTLPEPVQDRVREMFRALERPVIVRHQNERRRIEAQAAVQAVVKNLGKRLPRMPFPPVAKDSNFEYETALDEHRSLESSLATVTDSIGLLKAEVEKEEALLANEKKQLQEMEKNAKRAETEKKRQMKNEHPVLRKLDHVSSGQEQARMDFTLSEAKDIETIFGELDGDAEVQDLLKQLNGHLQSMQNNTSPLDGLRDAITRSQAALSLTNMPED